MSFRTDGFEPSAYTIPPPRPGAHDQPAGDAASEPDHSATAGACQVDPMRPARNKHLAKVSP